MLKRQVFSAIKSNKWQQKSLIIITMTIENKIPENNTLLKSYNGQEAIYKWRQTGTCNLPSVEKSKYKRILI
jgi:hypothetical protein